MAFSHNDDCSNSANCPQSDLFAPLSQPEAEELRPGLKMGAVCCSSMGWSSKRIGWSFIRIGWSCVCIIGWSSVCHSWSFVQDS